MHEQILEVEPVPVPTEDTPRDLDPSILPETADEAAATEEPAAVEPAPGPLPIQEPSEAEQQQPEPASDEPAANDTSQSKVPPLQPPPRAAAALFETLSKALPNSSSEDTAKPDNSHRLTNFIDSK
jgi:hypothetical protein